MYTITPSQQHMYIKIAAHTYTTIVPLNYKSTSNSITFATETYTFLSLAQSWKEKNQFSSALLPPTGADSVVVTHWQQRPGFDSQPARLLTTCLLLFVLAGAP